MCIKKKPGVIDDITPAAISYRFFSLKNVFGEFGSSDIRADRFSSGLRSPKISEIPFVKPAEL
jgi:hypothetical protein